MKLSKSDPLKILFIRTDRIGDVLMNLPAIHLLRQTFPKAWITLMADQCIAEIFHHQEELDEIMEVDASLIKSCWSARFELFQKIRRIKYDMVIVSNADKFYHLLSFFSGIPERVGYNRKWGFLLTKKISDDKDRASRHEIDSNLRLAGLVTGKTWDRQCSIAVEQKAEARVEDLFKQNFKDDRSVIAVHAGTSNPQKRWEAARFAEVCRRIQSENKLEVVLIGGPEEKEASRSLAQTLQIRPMDWTGILSLRELVAFLSHERVKALVSVDSGPVHIAWMNQTPVVALYAKNAKGSDPVRWGPRDGKSEVIFKPIDEIMAEEVFLALNKVLAK